MMCDTMPREQATGDPHVLVLISIHVCRNGGKGSSSVIFDGTAPFLFEKVSNYLQTTSSPKDRGKTGNEHTWENVHGSKTCWGQSPPMKHIRKVKENIYIVGRHETADMGTTAFALIVPRAWKQNWFNWRHKSKVKLEGWNGNYEKGAQRHV
jgi:hypothetical protein